MAPELAESLGLAVYAHPLSALVALALMWLALNGGAELKRARRRKISLPKTRARHSMLAQAATVAMLLAFAGGLASTALLRNWPLLATAHGRLALAAMVLLGFGSALGMLLKHNRSERAAPHGVLGILLFLLALGVAVAGIDLLP